MYHKIAKCGFLLGLAIIFSWMGCTIANILKFQSLNGNSSGASSDGRSPLEWYHWSATLGSLCIATTTASARKPSRLSIRLESGNGEKSKVFEAESPITRYTKKTQRTRGAPFAARRSATRRLKERAE